MKTLRMVGWLVLLAGTLGSCGRPHESCRVQYRVLSKDLACIGPAFLG